MKLMLLCVWAERAFLGSAKTASKFKNCTVTAIDISKNSLAYAKRKSEELGIKNIEYFQADILDLKNISELAFLIYT